MDKTSPPPALSLHWVRVLAATALAALVATLVGQALLRMPAGDFQKFVAYLALSALATAGLAIVAGRMMERANLTLLRRLVVGVGVAAGVGVANVLVTAWLMFISTGHDLLLLVALLLFSSLLTVIFTLSTVSGASRAMDRVAEGIGQLALGNYSHRLPVTGRDEVSKLSASVNELASRLDDAREQQQALDRERRQLTVAVSHDLRTPLSRLRLALEMSGADSRESEAMIEDIGEIDAIIGQFLDFARGGGETRAPADLDALVRDVVEHYARRGSDVAFAATLRAGNLPLARLSLRRALMNLVDNALRYAGAPVEIAARRERDCAVIEVLDRGPGIPEAEADRLKRPFTRLDESRSGQGGAGLGLAIVERVAQAHGGRLELRRREGGGLSARLTLALRVAR